jgi:hypothetical protein
VDQPDGTGRIGFEHNIHIKRHFCGEKSWGKVHHQLRAFEAEVFG